MYCGPRSRRICSQHRESDNVESVVIPVSGGSSQTPPPRPCKRRSKLRSLFWCLGRYRACTERHVFPAAAPSPSPFQANDIGSIRLKCLRSQPRLAWGNLRLKKRALSASHNLPGQVWPDSGRIWATSAEPGPGDFGQTRPEFGQVRPWFGQVFAISDEHLDNWTRAKWAEIRPGPTEVDPMSARTRPKT